MRIRPRDTFHLPFLLRTSIKKGERTKISAFKMIIFKDLFTEKEILSDSYKMKLIDDFVYEVETTYMTKSGDKLSDEMFGGNPSAEEQGEELDEPSCKTGFDILLNHEDIEPYHEEPSAKQFVKTTMKKIMSLAKERIPEDRYNTVFKPKMNEFFLSGIGKKRFSNFQIFFSSGYIDENDGSIKAGPIFLDCDDTGMKGKMYFFKDLMIEEKM